MAVTLVDPFMIGSGAWSPLQLPGVAAWYDSRHITLSGSDVTQMSDRVGTRHATATGTARPTNGGATQNGIASIRFNGTSNYLHLASDIDGNGGATFLAVVKLPSLHAGNGGCPLICRGEDPGGWETGFDNGKPYLNRMNERADFTANTSLGTTTPRRTVIWGAAASRGAYLDGVADGSNTDSHNDYGTIGYIGTHPIQIAEFGLYDLFDLVICTGVLDATNIGLWDTWAKAEYAL